MVVLVDRSGLRPLDMHYVLGKILRETDVGCDADPGDCNDTIVRQVLIGKDGCHVLAVLDEPGS